MPTPQRSSDQQASLTAARDGRELAASGQPPMAVFSADLQGEFIACNSAFTALFGYSSAEVFGRDFSALFTPAAKTDGGSRDPLCQSILAAAASQHDYRGNLLARPKSGSSFPVQFSATLRRDSSGKAVALVAFVQPLADTGSSTTTAVTPAQASPAHGVVSRKIDDVQFILASPVMHKFMTLVDRVAGHTN